MRALLPLGGFLPVLAVLAVLMGSFAAGDAQVAPLPHGLTVPAGFKAELVAAAPLVERPVMANFDEHGRLYVVDSSGSNDSFDKLKENPPHRIVILEDTDHDGRFDKRTLFADKLVMPQGVLPYQGSVYVASPPSVWKLTDTNGDGTCDQRVEIVTKFGSSGNAADIHGPTLGPDGRLYLCDGRHGHEITLPDGSVDKSIAGGIFRFRTDGSEFERVAGGGFDNPVELDFLPDGDLVGTINLFHGNPRQDVLVHWVEGGTYPRADMTQHLAEFQTTGELLPAISELGHVAVSGMFRSRTEVLGASSQLYVAIFNLHKVMRAELTRLGSTWKSVETDFVTSTDPDFHPTDVLEDADGSLLIVNTGGWFRIGCPTSQTAKPDILGGLWRIFPVDESGLPRRLDDPRGTKFDFKNQMTAALGDPRPAVQARAIAILHKQGERRLDDVAAVIEQKPVETTPLARANALWALSRIYDDLSRVAIRIRFPVQPHLTQMQLLVLRGLRDADPGVRMVAAHVAGLHQMGDTLDELLARVSGDLPPVRRVAATALGRLGVAYPKSAETITKSLLTALTADDVDRFLEHALIWPLIRMNNPDIVRPYLTDERALVRRAALLTLDQMRAGKLTPAEVVPLLSDSDAAVQNLAVTVLGKHPEGAAGLLKLAGEWVSRDTLTDEQTAALRGVLLARIKDAPIQTFIGDTLAGTSPAVTKALLWNVVLESAVTPLPLVWANPLVQVLETGSPAEQRLALAIVRDRRLTGYEELIQRIATAPDAGLELQVDAWAALADRVGPLADAAFTRLLSALDEGVPPFTAAAAADVLAIAPLSEPQLLALAPRVNTAGAIAAPRLVRAFAKSTSEAVGLALVNALQSAAIDESAGADLQKLLAGYPDAVRQAADPLLKRLGTVDLAEQAARLDSLLAQSQGGDAVQGRFVFYGQKAACASCHAVKNQGGRIGPDLSTIGGIRTQRDLLEAIIYPSASFARDFRPVAIETTDGRLLTGIPARQTAETITLRTADLRELRIQRTQIESMAESNLSIMPKGIETTLSSKELKDLLAYLAALK
jgi:putative membrane-bound dehydrogenase-like protein